MKLRSAGWIPLIAAVAGVIAYAQDTIKVKVETVQVYATVTDLKGRFVTNLKESNFKIQEDGKEQQVNAFSSDDSPLSVGLIFDDNGYIGDNFPLARQAALTFLNVGNLNNEYFVIEFNSKPQITEDYTNDLARLANHSPALHATRDSSELDAIELGLETLRRARNPRKALLVLGSGGYSKNEVKAAQVRNLARKLDVQIFGVILAMPSVPVANTSPMACADRTPGVCGISVQGSGYDRGLDIIDSIGGEGGFAADSAADFTASCRRIGVALRNQYILAYQSTNPQHDGTYRRLGVKLQVRDVPDLRVHTRDGYYAFEPDGGQN